MEFIPYGGGLRRCIGAAFAAMEMRTPSYERYCVTM